MNIKAIDATWDGRCDLQVHRAVQVFLSIFERAENPADSIRRFGEVFCTIVRETAREEASQIAFRVGRDGVAAGIAEVTHTLRNRVVSIAVDPGFDGVPSALFALTEDGDLWQRMVHADPPAWERVPLPPGSAAPPSAHERHLREFRRLVEQQLDPKLVQDLYDMAEEGSAQDTTTTTTTTETTG